MATFKAEEIKVTASSFSAMLNAALGEDYAEPAHDFPWGFTYSFDRVVGCAAVFSEDGKFIDVPDVNVVEFDPSTEDLSGYRSYSSLRELITYVVNEFDKDR